jgi:hypothetical protein
MSSKYSIHIKHNLGRGGAFEKLQDAASYYKTKYPSAKINYHDYGGEINLTFWAKGRTGLVKACAHEDHLELVLQVPKGTLVPAPLLKAFVRQTAQKWLDGETP